MTPKAQAATPKQTKSNKSNFNMSKDTIQIEKAICGMRENICNCISDKKLT